jgi:chromosome segregation ATPase
VNEIIRTRDDALAEVRRRDETIRRFQDEAMSQEMERNEEILQLRAAKAQSDRELAESRRRLRDREKRQQILQDQVWELGSAYEIANKENIKWRKAAKDLDERYRATDKKMKEIDDELTVHILLKTTHQKAIADLGNQLRSSQDSASETARAFRRVSNQAAEATAEVARLRTFEEESERLRPQIGELRDRLRESQRTGRETEEQLRASKNQQKVQAKRFAYVQQALIESTVEKRQGVVEVKALQSFREELKLLRTTLANREADIRRLELQVQDAQKHTDALKKALDQIKAERETLKRDVEKLFGL